MAKKKVKKSKEEIYKHMSRNRNQPRQFIEHKIDVDNLPEGLVLDKNYDPKKDRSSDKYVDPEFDAYETIDVPDEEVTTPDE